MTTLDVHQCFRCELRFASLNELRDHLEVDHPEPPPPVAAPPAGTICVAVAPSDLHGAVPVAAVIAAQAGMALEVVTVDEPGLTDLTLDVYLRRCAETARDAGASAVSTTRLPGEDGNAAQQLLDHLRATSPELAVLATHGRTTVGELAFGSVSTAVLRGAAVPVLLVSPHVDAADRYDRVVHCWDGSPTSQAALAVAVELASRLGAVLWIVEVVTVPVPPDVLETASVERVAGGVGSLPGGVSYDVLHGDPGHAIAEFAGHGGTIVVMGTHGRSAARRLVVGSVAHHVVHHAAVPVVVVPPGA